MFDYLNKDIDGGLEFDGLWLDMNEATAFCNGYCIDSERPKDTVNNKIYYVPGQRDLETKALGLDGRHANNRTEYDVHNLFSLTQVKATSQYLSEKHGLRPYVLSRSNYPGLAKWGHHWLGDNWSTVEYMKLSVDGLYSYSLFGIPFIGCDICGFNGDAAPDLCAKWHQLGSMYPFSRNHNQNASASQEPYRFNITWDGDMTYTDIIRDAVRAKYNWIRYYYSQFWNIKDHGGSFWKPLFFEFPADPESFEEIQVNIMLGDALKASIETRTLTPVNNMSTFYFPPGGWCQIFPAPVDNTTCWRNATGQNVTLQSKLKDYYIHLREGFIVPHQDAAVRDVNVTK